MVVVFSVVILKLPSRTTTQFKLAVSGLFLPLFGLAASAEQLADQAGQSLTPRSDINRQLHDLQRENEQLRLQLIKKESELANYIRILQILDKKEEGPVDYHRILQSLNQSSHSPWTGKVARVIGRDPANWWRNIRIDLGLRDAIPTNAPVLNLQGSLVGRVVQLGYSHSQVVLLGDPDCRVSALVESTRDHGIITPDSSSPLDNILVDLSYLSRNSPLKAGQLVVTSGLGGIFPKGIPIGQIVDFHSVEFGLYIEARVRVAAKLNALEEVMVLVQ